MSESMPLMMNLQASPAGSSPEAATPDDATQASQAPFDGLLQGLFATFNDPNLLPVSPLSAGGMPMPPAGGVLPGSGNSLPNPLHGAAPDGNWSLLLLQNGDGASRATLAAGSLATPAGTGQGLSDSGEDALPAGLADPLLSAQLQLKRGEPEAAASIFERNLLHQLNPELAESVSRKGEPDSLPLTGTSHNPAGLFSQAGHHAMAGRADTMTPPMPVPPQHPQWGQALGERMQWLVGQNLQQAEIRLDPPELGSLDVKIQIHRDTATVTFVSPHAQVRDAVEAATARLREMLGDVGLNLGDVNVSQESFQQQQMAEQEQGRGGTGNADASLSEADGAGGPEPVARGPRPINGLLDTYA